MGIFSDLFGGTQKRKLFFFWDDNQIEFIDRSVQDSCYIQKGQNDVMMSAHALIHRNLYPFYGFGGIKADNVTVAYEGDIILEPHPVLSTEEKPEVGNKLVKDWVIKKGEAQQYKAQAKPHRRTAMDVIVWVLIAAASVQIIAFGIRLLSAQYGGG